MVRLSLYSFTQYIYHCHAGVTRKTVIDICKKLNISIEIRRISLAEFHSADEVFTTGTMGELTPVNEIDGRPIGSTSGAFPGELFCKIQNEYKLLTSSQGYPVPF